MFRIISGKRLADLEERVHAAVRDQVKAEMRAQLAEQAVAFWKREAEKWEGRASSFIDQVGLKAGIIAAPTMSPGTEAAGTSPVEGIREVMRALAVTELPDKPNGQAAPVIEGVNPEVAAAVVAEALKHL